MTIPMPASPWRKSRKPTPPLALVLGLLLAAATAGCTHRAAPAPPAPPPPAAATAPAPAAASPVTDPLAAKMPEGAGKAEVVNLCVNCHGLARIVRQHQTVPQWEATLQSMQDNGLEATPAQLKLVLSYLSKNYGPTH